MIFVCKYRKKLLVSKQIADDIKQFSYEICQKHHVIIRYMETDKDPIHYMIETEPTVSVSKIVNPMKSYTTYHIWKRHQNYLQKHFWKEHTFWTDGYFACSVGSISEEMLRRYIEIAVALFQLIQTIKRKNKKPTKKEYIHILENTRIIKASMQCIAQ